MSKRIWLVAAIVCVGIGIATWIGLGRKPQDPLEVAATTKPIAKSEEKAADPNFVMQGGSPRKAAPTQLAQKTRAAKPGEEHDSFYYGSTPAVALDANPQVKSVVEAIRNKKHPERLSALIAPKPFDAKAFKADPTAYLNVVEPARVFQVAQPGPGVPRLRSNSPTFRQILQGESTSLQVKAPANSPVTFTSFDLGQFENQLTSMTVQANAQGIAEVKFIASPGTIEDVHILAGSPSAAGQVRFTVNVQMPGGANTADAGSQAAHVQGQLTSN